MSDDLTTAIAEAVASEAGQTFIASLQEEEGEAPVSTPEAGEGPSKVSTPESEALAETPVEGTADEVPTDYWGLNLEGVAPETRAEVIAALQRDDGYIKKLQAELAEARTVQEAQQREFVPPGEPEELSDEDLLKAAGYDPEDYEVQNMSRFILPSLRRELALEDRLTALQQSENIRATENRWTTELDALEAEYGAIPGFSRLDVLQHAVEKGIATPFEAYAALRLPVQKEADSIIAEARRKAAAEVAKGSVKPSGSTAGTDPVQPGLSLRDAVEQAARSAEKETGRRWRDVLGFDKQ